MSKHKVYLSDGSSETISADFRHIEWSESKGGGVLRFYKSDNDKDPFAVFPPGGWNGVLDLEI